MKKLLLTLAACIHLVGTASSATPADLYDSYGHIDDSQTVLLVVNRRSEGIYFYLDGDSGMGHHYLPPGAEYSLVVTRGENYRAQVVGGTYDTYGTTFNSNYILPGWDTAHFVCVDIRGDTSVSAGLRLLPYPQPWSGFTNGLTAGLAVATTIGIVRLVKRSWKVTTD